MVQKKVCCSIGCWTFAVILISSGVCIILLLPGIFKSNLVIKPGSLQYGNWYEPEVPVYMQWYIFNLTNVDAVKASTAKPSFQQLGPYTYREHRIKSNISWLVDGQVRYENLKWWTFEADKSVGSESDTIWSVNLPYVTVAESLRYEPSAFGVGFKFLAGLFGESLYRSYTMKQLIWGYHDPMMTMAHEFFPHWFYTDFLGIYAGKNYTNDGEWTVYTGEKNLSTVGKVALYNGTKYLSYWSSQYANMVNGTDGTIAMPGVTTNDTMYFFIPDVCRSLYTVYGDTEKSSEGIPLYRFSAPRSELDNATINPDNAGFCTPPGNCILGSGMINLTSCQKLDGFNIPIIGSQPHFLYADQRYLDAVEGLHPIEKDHRTDVYIEPRTGIVMKIAKRLQINVFLRPIQEIADMANLQEMVFPVVWLNESAVIDKPNQDKFISLMSLLDVANVGSYVLLGLGSVLFLLASVFLIRYIYTVYKQRKGYTRV